jgi:carboxymethylenebutenolidase
MLQLTNMKKLFIIIAFVFGFHTIGLAQHACCVASNVTLQNQLMAQQPDFAQVHAEPRPFTLNNAAGIMIQFATPDGKQANAYVVKAAKKSKKYLFVFHEWWGLNDYIKREADQFAADLPGVNIVAIDLYDGAVTANREEAAKLMSGLSEARAQAIVAGAFAYAGKNAKVATTGWCMGGAWSLQAAIAGTKQVKGCVMYYGFPEMNVEKLKRLQTSILGIFAEKDAFINVETVKQFELKLAEAGKQITVYNYVAVHAFANPSNPDYNQQAAKDAYENKVLPYLRKALKIK